MKRLFFFFGICVFSILSAEETKYNFPHENIKQYSMHGNFQKALASKAMGAKEFEIWQSSIAVNGKTPRHVHETEEVFILLKGKLLAKIGDEEVVCEAPATLICPAKIPHQLINIGDEPTEQILVLGINSKIYDNDGVVMQLPWRAE